MFLTLFSGLILFSIVHKFLMLLDILDVKQMLADYDVNG